MNGRDFYKFDLSKQTMRYRHFFIILIFIITSGLSVNAQPSDDSVSNAVSSWPVIKQIDYFDSLSIYWRATNQTAGLRFANLSVALAESKLPQSKSHAHALSVRAKAFRQMSKYEKALNDQELSLSIFTALKDNVWIGTLLSDMGGIYYKKGEYDKALACFLKAIGCAELTKDKDQLSICLNNTGNIYTVTGDYDRAIKYYLRSYDLKKEMGQTYQSALILDNIALIYSYKEEYDMALMYSLSAARILEKSQYRESLGEIYMNLGSINVNLKKYDAALDYFNKSYEIHKESNSKFYMAGCLINLGDVYRLKGNYNQSLSHLYEARSISLETESHSNTMAVYENLSETFESMKKPDSALHYFKLFSYEKDSVVNEESTSQVNELSTKYETEKKEQEIELLTREADLKDSRLKHSRILNISVIIGLLLVLTLAGLTFYRYIEKRKANSLLEEKNIAIHEQKELVTEKNREITDSINYAKRIQDAMLPSQKILNEYFKENFIFYQPKDIISGDFYWATRKNDTFYLAAADCTGHGVPGALMSMIGISFLRQVINEMNISDTAQIMNKLHEMVLNALNEDLSLRNSKDGMDIALLKIDLINRKAQFTGAVRPLGVSDKNGFQIIKGDRFSIGGIKTMSETFSATEISLEGSKSFYMFSDGYGDQFGEMNGKKFMTKKLHDLLAEITGKPMSEQHVIVDSVFNEWKGKVEQTDDVMLIGIKV